MHATAYAHMQMCVELYLPKNRHIRVLDVGSRQIRTAHDTHRRLLEGRDFEYIGTDVAAGDNVDVQMSKPYRFPFRTDSFDVVMTNQAFEHIPFPWVSFLEMSRVVRPGGYVFVVAPSRGQRHGTTDCWRYYPDSMRALAAIARMQLVEAYVDLPPRQPNGRPDYAAVGENWWGDAVGVFRKPAKYSRLVRVIREVDVWWANRVGGVSHVPMPPIRPQRREIGPRLAGQQAMPS